MPIIKQIRTNPSNGLSRTIYEMSLLEKKAFNTPSFVSFVYQNFSSGCLACIPGKIWKYMTNNFTFKKDEPYDEILIAPYLMLDIKKGDCDDFSLFAKTCLDIIGGWYVNYLVLGREKGKFTHIVVFAHRGKVGNDFIDPVIIDGVNSSFNVIPTKYNYYKIL